MVNISESQLMEFVKVVVNRGLGLYGAQEIAKICYESGVALTDTYDIDWLAEDHFDSTKKLLINYGLRNLPAKMTAIVLARQYNFPVPKELMEDESQKKKKLFKLFKRA